MIPLTILNVVYSLVAFGIYTILPGASFVRVLYKQRDLGVFRFISLSIGWSMAINAFLAYGVHFAGGTLVDYGRIVILLGAVSLIYILTGLWRNFSWKSVTKNRRFLSAVIVCIVGVVWFGIILQNGPRVDYTWDQWYHIAHVDQAIEDNCIFPSNAFWSDVELGDAYGLWHIVLGAAARVLRIDVLILWRVGNAYLAFVSFILMYVVATMILDKFSTSLLAAIVFLGSGVGAQGITRTFVYPWGISYVCMWLSLGLFFRYWKTGDRLSLLSATISGLIPIFVHPQEYIMLCFALFALTGAVGILPSILNKTGVVGSRRIWVFFLILLILGLPLMVFNYADRLVLVLQGRSRTTAANPALPLYQHPLASWLAAAFPYYWKVGMLYFAVMNFNIISLLSLRLLPDSLDAKARKFLTTLTWAPMVAAVVPGFSWLAQKVLLETYSWRLLNLIPTPMIWALLIRKWLSYAKHSARKTLGTGKKWIVIGWGYFGMGVVLLAVVATSIIHVVLQDEMKPVEGITEDWAISPLQSREVFDRLDQLMVQAGVVLSDPTTSYAVPGLTKHRVVLNEPSHGTREDIIVRYTEMRELLSSPFQPAKEAITTLQRYQVNFILVHKIWIDKSFFNGTPFYSEYTLKLLRENPACFQPVYCDQDFEAFQYIQCDPVDMKHKGQVSVEEISIDSIEHVKKQKLTNNLRFLGFSLPDKEEVASGENVTVDLYWQAEDVIREPYAVWIELIREYPEYDLPYGKVFRIIRAEITGKELGVVSFAYMPIPPSGIEPGDVYSQSFTLQVPSNMDPGYCELNLHVLNRRQFKFDQEFLPAVLMEKRHTLPTIQLRRLEVNP